MYLPCSVQVMNRGGSAAVTAADGWSELAFDFQRDSEVADKVHAVYQCYLHPLELDLPFDFRWDERGTATLKLQCSSRGFTSLAFSG